MMQNYLNELRNRANLNANGNGNGEGERNVEQVRYQLI